MTIDPKEKQLKAARRLLALKTAHDDLLAYIRLQFPDPNDADDVTKSRYVTTPLALILDDPVNLDRADMIVGHTQDGPVTTLVAQDPDHPEYGSIRLAFSANPTELRQWVVADDTGQETTVILGTFRTGVTLGSLLFNLDAELQRRGLSTNR